MQIDIPPIPTSLIEARNAFEAARASQAAIAGAATEMDAAVTAAAVRRTELEGEIARRRGAILRAKALAKMPPAAGVERMGARDLAAAERELAALCAENGELQQKAEEAEAGALALADEITAAAADVVAAAAVFIKEARRFDVDLAAGFARDVGRLPLPDLFKWGATGHWGILKRLAGLGVETFSKVQWNGKRGDVNAPILSRGYYLDPELGSVDWGTSWQADQPLMALGAALAEIRSAAARAEALVVKSAEQRRLAAQLEREAETRRRQAEYRPAAVSRYTYTPPLTRLEAEPRTPPAQIIGPVLGDT